jgi:hypothetical protein
MADVVNDHFVLPDFIHDQIITDGETPKVRFACCLAHEWGAGDSCGNFFNVSNKTRSRRGIVLRNVCENLIEIGKRAAFIP